MSKSQKKHLRKKELQSEVEATEPPIEIDPSRNWIFSSEDELFSFFKKDITRVEDFFYSLRQKALRKNISKAASLEFTLDNPGEIWEDEDFFSSEEEGSESRPLWVYIKDQGDRREWAFCHVYDGAPTFIYIFFSLPLSDKPSNCLPSTFKKVYESQQSDGAPLGAIEGDSLCQLDPLAVGLYEAMLTLKSSEDLSEEEFLDFSDMREPTIEDADEIWRSMDSYGNNLVYFIKEFDLSSGDYAERLFYVVCTIEDEVSETNVLLFSFPTFDESLVDRYRVGENLQSEEVVQEGSH